MRTTRCGAGSAGDATSRGVKPGLRERFEGPHSRSAAYPLPARSSTAKALPNSSTGIKKKPSSFSIKAYLLDPEDPFTLNNLGYVAELEGDADRALRYYALAARQHTDAVIDQSNEAALKGKPLDEAFRQVQDSDQEVSKVNEQAIVLLQARASV